MSRPKTVVVRYVGPAEGRNHDVAAATRGGPLMVRGKTYRVPRELADRLLVTRDFQPAAPARAGHEKED